MSGHITFNVFSSLSRKILFITLLSVFGVGGILLAIMKEWGILMAYGLAVGLIILFAFVGWKQETDADHKETN